MIKQQVLKKVILNSEKMIIVFEEDVQKEVELKKFLFIKSVNQKENLTEGI